MQSAEPVLPVRTDLPGRLLALHVQRDGERVARESDENYGTHSNTRPAEARHARWYVADLGKCGADDI